MGKTVQVKPDFRGVTLPPNDFPFSSGDITTLTDAEYNSLPASEIRAITVTGTVADPIRTPLISPTSLADATNYSIQRSHHTGTQTLSTINDAGNAAGLNVGSASGTVAAGNDSRIVG